MSHKTLTLSYVEEMHDNIAHHNVSIIFKNLLASGDCLDSGPL